PIEYRCRYSATEVFPGGWFIQHDCYNEAWAGSRRIAYKCGEVTILCITVAFRLVSRASLASHPITLDTRLWRGPTRLRHHLQHAAYGMSGVLRQYALAFGRRIEFQQGY